MPFDFGKLLDDPSFQFGASLIGNTGQPNAVANALGNMAKVNQMKQAAAAQQAQSQLGQDTLAETTRYHSGQLDDAKATRLIQQEQYQRQNALTQQQISSENLKYNMQRAIMQALAPKLGFTLPPDSASDNSDGADGNSAQAGGAQGNSAMYNIPQGGQLNMPQMPPGQLVGNGVHYDRALPGPDGQGQPTPTPNFNPDASDPAGPFSGRGGFGAPGIGPGAQGKRPMLQTGTGRHGTPQSILNGLQQTESSGNPQAINQQSGAMGAFQFMPSTVDMIRHSYNPQFDPFDPAQARDAADFLMSQRLTAHGGDLRKALADYGGFVTKDPTSYVQKVTRASLASQGAQGAQVQQGMQAPPQQQAAPQGGSGIDMGQAGALMALGGMPGGNTLVQLGQMMEPKSVSPNSWQRDPTNNKMTYIPDPMKSQELEMQARRLANENAKMPGELQAQADTHQTQQQGLRKGEMQIAKEGAEAVGAQQGLAKTRAVDTNNLYTLQDKVGDINDLVNKALASPGLKYNTGYYGALGLDKVPGLGRDAKANLDQLASKMRMEMLTALKSMSKNGSSGMGQLSDREGETLQNYVANLDKAQSETQLRDQLNKIKVWANRLPARMSNEYQMTYGANAPADPSAQAPQGAPAGAGVMSLNDYLTKHKR